MPAGGRQVVFQNQQRWQNGKQSSNGPETVVSNWRERQVRRHPEPRVAAGAGGRWQAAAQNGKRNEWDLHAEPAGERQERTASAGGR